MLSKPKAIQCESIIPLANGGRYYIKDAFPVGVTEISFFRFVIQFGTVDSMQGIVG